MNDVTKKQPGFHPGQERPPQGVVLHYTDGSEVHIETLLYVGDENEEEGSTNRIHVWEALDPLPSKEIARMEVGMLPSHTRVVVVR